MITYEIDMATGLVHTWDYDNDSPVSFAKEERHLSMLGFLGDTYGSQCEIEEILRIEAYENDIDDCDCEVNFI